MDAATEIAPEYLRLVLGRFATGVAIVTTAHQGRVLGLTVNSFTSVSLKPPLVLWCLDHRSNRLAAFSESEDFAINILRSGYDALSARFSRDLPYIEPNEALSHSDRPLVLTDALAWLVCRKAQTLILGDHDVLVGEVTGCGADEGEALTYFRGQYGVTG